MAAPPWHRDLGTGNQQREASIAAAAVCHLPVQWRGCDSASHVPPLHLSNHSSCSLPCPGAHQPHLSLRTSLQCLCTSARNAIKMSPGPPVPAQVAGGVSCPEASVVPVHCKPSPRCCHTVQCQLPSPSLISDLPHVPRMLMLPRPRFAAALQPPLMSSFPFTCSGEGRQGAELCWIIHITGELRDSP